MARKTKERALLTRELILDAGERLFIERGYRSVSLEEIAEAAGVTRGALYWHFSGKGDLLLDIFIRLRDQVRRELSQLMQCKSRDMARRKVVHFCRVMLSDGDERKGKHVRKWIAHHDIFLEEALTAPFVGELFRELHIAMVDAVFQSRDGGGTSSRSMRRESEQDALFLQALLVGYARLSAMRAQPRQARMTVASMMSRGMEKLLPNSEVHK